ncbi:uncharacterized protein LOC132178026 [Corylus avellana]|uniref:uncharacterized protein LOC132178026 n=1 Tax=Corylus avellana TaxID=13451 RepID=UPI00286A314D|nr:uncharacterized protein LOC132178026 [Corylus avellana]
MANQVIETITKKLDQVLLTVNATFSRLGNDPQPYQPQSIYRPPQQHYQAPSESNFEDRIVKVVTELTSKIKRSIKSQEEIQVQAITTLRSDKIVDNHVEEKKDEHKEVAQNLQNDKSKQVSNEASSSAASTPEIPYEPPALFPECLKRKTRNHILKKVLLIEQVSSLIKHNTPLKFKDPEAPTISCIIGKREIDKALLDLGAGVNLLPYSVYQQLGLGELKPTTMILIEEYIEDSLPSLLTKDPVEACLNYFNFEEFNTDQYIQEVHELFETAASADFHPWRVVKEPLPVTSSTPPVPSLLSPLKLELKPLPEKLKYAFLGSNNTLPVIIASDLQKDQEDSLLAVLKEYKEAIGSWQI